MNSPARSKAIRLRALPAFRAVVSRPSLTGRRAAPSKPLRSTLNRLLQLFFKLLIKETMNRIANAAKRARAARACLSAAMLFVAAPAMSQDDYGDTPYVQTPQHVVDKMLEIAKVGPKDYVIDLGSGDGRMVITAATKYGARG